MQRRVSPFHLGKADVLKNSFDPAIVLYTPTGEFRGRKQVMDYLGQRYEVRSKFKLWHDTSRHAELRRCTLVLL